MRQKAKSDKKTGKYINVAIFSVMVILAVTACLIASLFYSDDVKRKVVTVPDTEGLKIDEIFALDDFEFEENYVNSDDSQKGVILSQYPLPGSKKKTEEGKKLKIKINIGAGREEYEIPEFEGSDYREAAVILRQNGCAVKIVSVFSDTGVSGAVQSSNPRSGQTVHEGDTVVLYVTRVRTTGSVKVADLRGKDIDEAIEILLKAGLSLGEITEEYSSDETNNAVINQSLIPGSYVKNGTVIDLVVCVKAADEEYESFGADITDKSHSGAEDYTRDMSEKEPGEIFIPWNNYPGIYDEGEENTA